MQHHLVLFDKNSKMKFWFLQSLITVHLVLNTARSSLAKITDMKLSLVYGKDKISTHIPYQKVFEVSKIMCGMFCMDNDHCKGFNIREIKGNQGTCDIIIKTTDPVTDMIADNGSLYYERICVDGNIGNFYSTF